MRYALLSSVCLLAVLAVPAQAGQLFPPSNIGPNPNVKCPSGQVLTWNVDHVECTNPTPGVTVSCPTGQTLTGIQYGQPVCVPLSKCGADNVVTTPNTATCPMVPNLVTGNAINWAAPGLNNFLSWTGNEQLALKFTATLDRARGGLLSWGVSTSGQASTLVVTISACPGQRTSEMGAACTRTARSGTIAYIQDGGNPGAPASSCNLVAGQTYFVNIADIIGN
jgi:hypothetical protein